MAWSPWESVEGFDFKEIVYEKKWRDRGGGVARISFNRTQVMNAMTGVGFREIVQAVTNASRDENIAVITFTGKGDHFGVGGDVNWEAAGGLAEPGGGGGFNQAIKNSPKPSIAAVKGYCIGAHNHLAYTCDFTIASDEAILGQNGPRVGSPVHGYLVGYLAHVVGVKRAKEIWMLCRQYTAQEALQMGLVNAVVPLASLEEEVDRWCEELMGISPTILTMVKQSYEAVGGYLHADSGRILNLVNPNIHFTDEIKEAQRAFLEFRPPEFWKGRKKFVPPA